MYNNVLTILVLLHSGQRYILSSVSNNDTHQRHDLHNKKEALFVIAVSCPLITGSVPNTSCFGNWIVALLILSEDFKPWWYSKLKLKVFKSIHQSNLE
jgi:hypothetical protein